MSKFNKLLLIWLKGDGQGLKGDTCGLYINRTGQETNRGMSDVIVPPFFPRRFCLYLISIHQSGGGQWCMLII